MITVDWRWRDQRDREYRRGVPELKTWKTGDEVAKKPAEIALWDYFMWLYDWRWKKNWF